MLRWLYRRIIGKLRLSSDQLKELRDKLQPSNICAYQFVEGGKMCPNTIALSIKEHRQTFKGKSEIKALLKQHGVTQLELWIFLLIYDLPAVLSQKFFEKSLMTMRSTIETMI
jgi:hypothetical protein